MWNTLTDGVHSLQQSLRKFCADEVMEFDNAYNCETCAGKERAVRHTRLHTLPPVLTVQLKRFAYTMPFTSPVHVSRSLYLSISKMDV